jgi:aryl-alcohol dehydrogenase-like predicted oxidoreductase
MAGVIPRTALSADYTLSRIIKGGWQLSAGHSPALADDPVADMFAFAERGIDTFDCADIYTGVESLIGQFLRANRARSEPLPVRVHTKYVPDEAQLGRLRKADVEHIIDRSLERLGVERLDMVQFHWWNYAAPGCEEAAHWLAQLQQAGKIELLSLTNFNTTYTRQLLESGLRLATTQVQYSLLDPRPEKSLLALCRQHGMQLLCYGTLAGGFLSARWLGRPAPATESLENRSLIKYRLMIEEAGGWDAFQALLDGLGSIAERHGSSISAVASRWVLEQPEVAAVIIGARHAGHLEDCVSLFAFGLDEQDHAVIAALRGELAVPPGDVFDLEREREGPHGRIMHYNLNAG